MYLFMFIIIPAILVYSCIRAENKIVLLLSLAGAFTGVLVSICTALFTYLHRVPDYNLFSNFFYYLLTFYALPMILLYSVYFFITKDSLEIRVKAFFPLTASFYAVFMPFMIIGSDNCLNSFFMLFAKPVLLISMLFVASRLLYNIFDGSRNSNLSKILVNSLLFLMTLSLPALMESMWILNMAEILVYAISIVFGLFALGLFFVESRREYKYFF